MTTRLHPLYKDVARQISGAEDIFYTDGELAEMLEEDLTSDEYNFARMNLVAHLLDEYGIDFIRAANEISGKGYKIATSEESVVISAARLQRKIRNGARKQRKVLSIVDRSQLEAATQVDYDAYLIRGGLLQAFFAQTPLCKCYPGVTLRIDRPALIQNEAWRGQARQGEAG
jgi:hypothetical protein